MPTIYRIENGHRVGPYNGGEVELMTSTQGAHTPSPAHDLVLKAHFKRDFFGDLISDFGWRHYHYGFGSIKQLRAWFTDAPAVLDELAHKRIWHCSVYDAPDALIGATQAVFNPKTAKLVATLKLTDLDATPIPVKKLDKTT